MRRRPRRVVVLVIVCASLALAGFSVRLSAREPEPPPRPTPMEQLCAADAALCDPPPAYGPGGFVPEVQ